MKKLKIIFCIVLIISIAFGVMGLRLGKNKLDASVEKVMNTNRFAELYLDRSLFTDFAHFGYTQTEFERKFIDNYENCYAQRVKISLINKNRFDITVLGVELKEGNGKNEIYISTVPEKIITVPANSDTPHSVWFMVMSEGPDKNETFEIIKNTISMKLIYADASKNIGHLNEASEDDLIYEWIR